MERFKREVGRFRRDGFQQQRKLVCVCTEGTVTERSYLECLEFAFKKKLKSQGKEDDTKFSFVYTTENKKTAPAYLLNLYFPHFFKKRRKTTKVDVYKKGLIRYCK